jgi:Fis family transcriptional regulator, factor for inversion stimulation protein
MSLDATMVQEKSLEGLNYTTRSQKKSELLRDSVVEAMQSYFAQMDGHKVSDLYRMVLSEVEPPLFESVLRQTGGNQSRAAEMLGISRSTLRKKLAIYNLD